MTRNKPKGLRSGRTSAEKRGGQKESLRNIAKELGASLIEPTIERTEETKEPEQEGQEQDGQEKEKE